MTAILKDTGIDDYEAIFINSIPLLDVRAPIEYVKGAFPNSTNIPLLDDQQRHEIGLCYKQSGQEKAIERGWQSATPALVEQRQQAWRNFCDRHPDAILYCFRGGLRSQISQKLIAQAGVSIPRVTGGFKALRQFLIGKLEMASQHCPLILVSGPTGSGKTQVIHQLHRKLDLEGLAKHRGSAFGADFDDQPSQIDFENRISIAWLQLYHNSQQPVFIEDESRLIGRCALPLSLQNAMGASAHVIVEEEFEQRINIVLDEYVVSRLPLYQHHYQDQAIDIFSQQLQNSLFRIRKRLGMERFKQLITLFSQAETQLKNTGTADGYRDGITLLLRDYYDPMYQYQFKKRQGTILFKGDRSSVIAWANERYPLMPV